MNRVISIDPGIQKCGLLLADIELGLVLDARIVDSRAVSAVIVSWINEFHVENIILGNGTSSKYWEKIIKDLVYINIQIVDERGTTLRARFRYWELWPPKKWFSWLPRGILLPPKYLDSIAALVLLEDHLNRKLTWKTSPDFRILL